MKIACLQPRAIQFDLIRGLRDKLDVGAGQARLARVGAGQARLARRAQARLQANETNELQNLFTNRCSIQDVHSSDKVCRVYVNKGIFRGVVLE